jgi:hypothetical protein
MPNPPGNQRLAEYLTVGAAADFLGVSPWTLRNWDKANKLRPMRHPKNGYRIYRREDLAAILRIDGDTHIATAPPPAHWNPGESDHVVQFYESDAYLAESVAGYVAAGLAAGQAAAVVATPAHRDAIHAAIVARGADVQAAIDRGDYVVFDAAQTLAKIMAGPAVDRGRFEATVGKAIGQLARPNGRRRRVRVFGELVALLWAAGNRAAAVDLENLWNDLAHRHTFALLCAYPLAGFGAAADTAAFADVCACHSRVIPTESFTALPTEHERMREVSRLQQRARAR